MPEALANSFYVFPRHRCCRSGEAVEAFLCTGLVGNRLREPSPGVLTNAWGTASLFQREHIVCLREASLRGEGSATPARGGRNDEFAPSGKSPDADPIPGRVGSVAWHPTVRGPASGVSGGRVCWLNGNTRYCRLWCRE